MSEMDATDAKQQQEIDSLQRRAAWNDGVDHAQWQDISKLQAKDERHDALLSVMKGALMLLIILTFLNWFILFLAVYKVGLK